MELEYSKHRAVKYKVNGNRIYARIFLMFEIRSDMSLNRTLIKNGTQVVGKILISMTLSVGTNINQANPLKNQERSNSLF
jgi:hypothetical protein